MAATSVPLIESKTSIVIGGVARRAGDLDLKPLRRGLDGVADSIHVAGDDVPLTGGLERHDIEGSGSVARDRRPGRRPAGRYPLKLAAVAGDGDAVARGQSAVAAVHDHRQRFAGGELVDLIQHLDRLALGESSPRCGSAPASA